MEQLLHLHFWVAVGQIVIIDILLGGDNAVVIALACRKLPANLRTKGIVWGTVGAIGIRVLLIGFALTLLAVPYLKIVGAVLLMWIGVKLLVDNGGDDHANVPAEQRLWAAVKTIIVADLVMSVDNVIAIAGAATSAGQDSQLILVIFGLVVSVPIIVWGSQLVLGLMQRFPWIVTLGAMLLGWIAGTMLHSDPAIHHWVPQALAWKWSFGAVGAALVYGLAKGMARPSQQPD